MEEIPQQELPATYEWFADQIAGHHPSVIKNGKREIGLLKKRGSDKILKPKQEGFRGECEVNVYKLLARALRHSTSGDVSDGSGGDTDSDGWPGISMEDAEGLARMTPRFYGLTSVPIDKKDVDFLILEDVTSTYSLPAILDVKMGRITYDPVASATKREKEKRKYPPQTVLGFRLLGYRMHCKDGKIVVKDKEWGKSYDEYNILDDFSHVFPSNSQLDTNYIVGLNELHSKVKSILEKFSSMSASQTSTIEHH
ncbi:hypothetical protein TELCIR_02147 [Teladorsagia circumcincta]|uniref:Kinase n=1 Tax=Teladorsagia circumcincta TaxID=45464 RepID=A0A2G9UZV1_TELCI|nr:hypothetical protein TELCIR_02147 [Teladorsagia circumcincta]